MSHPTQARQTRAIGPIGTVSRLAAGLLLIGFPIVTHGIQAWDLAGALIVFPALSWGLYSLVSAVSQRSTRVNRLDETARSWFTNVSVLVLFLVIAIAATYVTPIDAGAIWLFFGLSMLVGAVRGDAGCEVLAIVNARVGRRDAAGCVVFAPLDSLDTQRQIAGPAR